MSDVRRRSAPWLQPPTSVTPPRNADAIRTEGFALPSPARVFASLLAIRIVNALAIKTFFQPDEYFQALEPAWQLTFGTYSGAWITWVRPALCDPELQR